MKSFHPTTVILLVCVSGSIMALTQYEPEELQPDSHLYSVVFLDSDYNKSQPNPPRRVYLIGTVINMDWILSTANHLLDSKKNFSISLKNSGIQSLPPTADEEIGIDEIIGHPRYHYPEVYTKFNLALVKPNSVLQVGEIKLGHRFKSGCTNGFVHMELVYWVLEYKRYHIFWKNRDSPTQCQHKDDINFICFTTKGDRPKNDQVYPCGSSALTVGSSVMIQGEFHGVYVGLDPRGDCPMNPDDKYIHYGIRFLANKTTRDWLAATTNVTSFLQYDLDYINKYGNGTKRRILQELIYERCGPVNKEERFAQKYPILILFVLVCKYFQ